MSRQNVHAMHMGIAEGGKLLALKGRHKEALARYRQALKLAQACNAPQVFPRHYLHCVLDSLELMGSWEDAARIATEAARAAGHVDDQGDFQQRDRAFLLERAGLNRLKSGDVDSGRTQLQEALALDASLLLTQQILQWLARRYTLDAKRIMQAQRKHNYFTVRADTVDAARAIEPPATMAL